jgi:hypothetical protein
VISRIIAGATKCLCEKKIAPIGFTKYFFDANFEIYTHEQTHFSRKILLDHYGVLGETSTFLFHF